MPYKSGSLIMTIESEIAKVKEDLRGVDENLRKLTGRDFGDPRSERRLRPQQFMDKEDEPLPKRRVPGGVFARLGGVVTGGDVRKREQPRDHAAEEEEVLFTGPKPSISSHISKITDGKTRTEVVAELSKDRKSRDRNRRMFGALLGTLQKFRTEEAKQREKEEQRAAIERKLEEKGKAEKEEIRRERLDLLHQRRERQAHIRRLAYKMSRVKEHEKWEEYQRGLKNFIRTKALPCVFWFPKQQNARSKQMLRDTAAIIEGELEEKQQELQIELDDVLWTKKRENSEEEEEEAEAELEEAMPIKRRKKLPSEPDDYGTCTDLLDFEAEEGDLLYEGDDNLIASGKMGGNVDRVVVQVSSEVLGGERDLKSHDKKPLRRVEVVKRSVDRGPHVESARKEVVDGEKETVRVKHKEEKERSGRKHKRERGNSKRKDESELEGMDEHKGEKDNERKCEFLREKEQIVCAKDIEEEVAREESPEKEDTVIEGSMNEPFFINVKVEPDAPTEIKTESTSTEDVCTEETRERETPVVAEASVCSTDNSLDKEISGRNVDNDEAPVGQLNGVTVASDDGKKIEEDAKKKEVRKKEVNKRKESKERKTHVKEKKKGAVSSDSIEEDSESDDTSESEGTSDSESDSSESSSDTSEDSEGDSSSSSSSYSSDSSTDSSRKASHRRQQSKRDVKQRGSSREHRDSRKRPLSKEAVRHSHSRTRSRGQDDRRRYSRK